MAKFIGILFIILAPLLAIALAVGRNLEENEERSDHDRAIREGMRALKRRILNLGKLRGDHRERRG